MRIGYAMHARKDEVLNDSDSERGLRFRAVCEYLFEPGITNVALAEAFGCTEGAIRKWNDGQRINGILVKLLAALGISEKYLIDGDGPMVTGAGEPPRAKTISAELRNHIGVLQELREVLHHYEIDAVRGAIADEEFGKFIRAVAETAAEAGKELERRERQEREKDCDTALLP